MKRRKPQLYPTRHLRSVFEVLLKIQDFVFGKQENRKNQVESQIPVSVLIPIHPKDLWIGRYSVKYLKKNLLHPISEILIVSPYDEEIKEWCREEGLEWLDESESVDWTLEQLGERLPEWAQNRKGWLFQQLIKLSADKLCKEEHILVLDADTLLVKERSFIVNGEVSLDYSHERNLLYLKSYRHLIGEAPSSWVSFVTHYMFMEKTILTQLKERIQSHCGASWDEAIVALGSDEIWTTRENEVYPFNFFSEYEIYGNFSKKVHGRVKSKYFRNFSVSGFDEKKIDVDLIAEQLPSFYYWASFHSYNSSQD